MDFGIEELLSAPTNVATSILCFTNACDTKACDIEAFAIGPVLSLLTNRSIAAPASTALALAAFLSLPPSSLRAFERRVFLF